MEYSCFPSVCSYTAKRTNYTYQSVQFHHSSLSLWSMVCSKPGFTVYHQVSEPAQTLGHRVSDAIQLYHPVFSPSPLIFNLSQHQDLSQWVSSSHQVVKVSELQLHYVVPMNIQDWFPLGWSGVIFLQSKGLSWVFSNNTVQKHQFCTQLSSWSNSHIHTWLLEKP